MDRLLLSDRRDPTIRMPGKSPFLFLSPLSLSLYLSPLFALPSFFFHFLLFSFFPYPLALPSLVCSIIVSCHFFPISFFSFSLLSLIILSLSFFSLFSLLDFHHSYGSSGGNFPPLSFLATCHHHVFLTYFL